jgi:hypothetical protein
MACAVAVAALCASFSHGHAVHCANASETASATAFCANDVA